jgi:hypothetical protein
MFSSFRWFPSFVVPVLVFLFLLGGATGFASWAHSDPEPMEGDWHKLNPSKGLAIALDERRLAG